MRVIRGSDADWIRAFVNERGAWANTPPKQSRKDPICFGPYLYRARNLVECFFDKIKLCRRIAARYDKLTAEYLAFIKLASIRIWLRAYEPTSWKPPLRETPFTAPQSDHYQPGNCTAKT